MKEDILDQLIHGLFEGELTSVKEAELNCLLKESPQARQRYVQATAVHSALSRLATAEQALPRFSVPLEKKVATRPLSGAWLALAACVVVALGAWFYGRLTSDAGLAVVSETRDLVWKPDSSQIVSGALAKGESLEFLRGYIRLTYPSGAEVTLEGPCRFSVNAREAITVTHGRVSVHAPPGAQGFIVDTPGGRFVDLGTEFGLAVGSDGDKPVVLTEVFTGEVEVQATQTPIRLVKGESRALVQDTGKPTLLASLDESPVVLVNHARELPQSLKKDFGGNLALGKPVFSPSFYANKHGSVFPPDRLTDGRLNDSGVPGDWGFWLAPNEVNGEFTVDLLSTQTIGRISLQNTNNRSIGDRGVAAFEIYGSLDNQMFFKITQGDLPRVSASDGTVFPFHDFSFAPVQARYVKLVVTEHYRHPSRPPERKDHGGGLNEIRIFNR
jgi:hypothetical protein